MTFMNNFWEKLNKPIFALAPMEDVTDCAFREMFARYGRKMQSSGLSEPAWNDFVMFTEFVSTEGLMHPEGCKKLSIDLTFTKIQRPIVAQIWGADPEKFYRSAEYAASLGFDGIDINMGCPQSKEIQANSCAALIRTPKLAQEIVRATQKGAGNLPVSVKTRLGYSKTDEMESWLLYLLETQPQVITLHARTKKEMSKVPAHWDKITEAVSIRNREKSNTLILGNGDIASRQDGLNKIAQTGADGVMVGRGAFGNPWFFNNLQEMPSLPQRLAVMIEHAQLYEKLFTGIKSFAIMKKHFKAYCSGFDGAAELRAKLMDAKDTSEIVSVVSEFLKEPREYKSL